MRIQIHAGHGGKAPLEDVPPPLARLSPGGELVLVELQGSLEMDGMDPQGGQTIGTLRFPPGQEDKPILQVSHHRLEGKLVKLTRPLAVLEKKVAPVDEDDLECVPDDVHSPPSSPPVHGAEPPSPTQERKRARMDAPETPVKRAPMPSSSPMPERAVHYSDGHYDFSSPQGGLGSQRAKPSTVTSYHVVTIVRHKLLFSKRPEPIVRLDG